MIKGHLAILILLSYSCTSVPKNEGQLESSETIQYSETGNMKIQLVFSSSSTSGLEIKDTSLLVQFYRDSLQIEEINYAIKNGDSIERSHIERTYNDQGLLLTEIVTSEGRQMFQLMNTYENSRLIISETHAYMPKKSTEIESFEYDTIKSRALSLYDEQNRGIKVYSIKQNDLLTALEDHIVYDTTLTSNSFDEKSNLVTSISTEKGDTIEIFHAEYDEKNRTTLYATTSRDFGTTVFKTIYDENNNTATEFFISNDLKTRTEIIYDSLMRPIRKRTFQMELPIGY